MKRIVLYGIALLFSLYSYGSTCDYTLNFSGFNCYVTCGNSSALTPNDGLTLEAWIYATDSISNQKIAGTIDPFSASGYEIGMDSARLYGEVKDVSGTLYSFKAGHIPANQWTHITMTYQSGSAIKGYINGIQVYSASAGGNVGNSGANDFIIGAAPWDQQYFNFFGKIDEVRVYGSVRTVAEIEGDMRIDVSALGQASLLGYWRFLEGSGTAVNDLSGNNHVAALSGNLPLWIDADGPYNTGTSTNTILFCCLTIIFGQQDVAITTNVLSVPEVWVVTKLNCDPGGSLPTGSNTYSYGYWVTDRYPAAPSFSGNMSFIVTDILIDPGDTPSDFILYHREANSNGAWTQLGTAISVDTVTHFIEFATGSATGQFMIGANGNTVLGINGKESKTVVHYPNPVSDQLHLQFNTSGMHHVEFKDMMGKTQIITDLSDSDQAIDVSMLISGSYFLSVDGKMESKVMVAK